MNLIHSIILGIVEGITEFLPVSSTGHLIITSKFLGIAHSDFLTSFEIFIQLGAILAVVFFYRKTIFSGLGVWKKILAAFIPTAIIGLALYKVVKTYLISSPQIVIVSLIIGGIILIIFETWQRKREVADTAGVNRYDSITEVPYLTAIYIGIAQTLAMIPGVSRSATTIVSGQLLSLTRKAVVEFSFLLAIPTMLAATSLDLLRSEAAFDSGEIGLLAMGFITSFVVALIVVKWLLSYIQKHTFIAFGIYRILAGIVFFSLLYF